MGYIGAFFFIFAILFIGLFPFPLLYEFSNIIRYLIYNIFGYRKGVVLKNLEGSFPDLSSLEFNRIVKLFYKNLIDVFLEGMRAFTMSRKQILKRHKIINPEVLESFYQSGQSVIGVTGHYANWEWGSLSASLQTKFKVVAFYKPLNNKYIDKFVRWSRTRFGTHLASIKETTSTFEKYKNTPTIFLMAADQGMPKKFLDRAYWVQFLNRKTAFLHGMEKHARINNLPVIYTDIQRLKRGYYTIELSVLTAKPRELEERQLTEIYARKLESIIIQKPEDWLWSHRRWKHSPPQ
jgi:Kdo2-lipid IVA lauroyltransferase/acyltransferase